MRARRVSLKSLPAHPQRTCRPNQVHVPEIRTQAGRVGTGSWRANNAGEIRERELQK